MAWSIRFTKNAENELGKLDKPIKQRVARFLNRVVTLPSPRVSGDALQGAVVGVLEIQGGGLPYSLPH